MATTRRPRVQLFTTFHDLAAEMAPWETWASAEIGAAPAVDRDGFLDIRWDVDEAGTDRVMQSGFALRVRPAPAGVTGLLVGLGGASLTIPWAISADLASAGVVSADAGSGLQLFQSTADGRCMDLRAKVWQSVPAGGRMTIGPVGLFVAPGT